ncbi:MAG: pyridoxal phosphate-dependent aminotransferase [Acidimicrobiales bacterium]
MVEIDPFYVMEVVASADAREREGNAVFHLEVGQPATGAPAGAIARAHQLLDEHPLGYTISRGIPELAPALSGHVHDWYGLDVDPGRIAITQGATGAFVLAILAAFEPRARVGVPVPGYPCYRNMLTAMNMEPVPIRVDVSSRFQPTTQHLDAAGPLDGLIVASPNNPTGTMLTTDELSAIAAWCDTNSTTLISDEIYHGLTYGDADLATAAAFSDRAIVINSFSKYFSMTGWRIGWTVLPEHLVTPFDRLAQNLVICPPSISQHVALAALDCHVELQGHVDRYAENRRVLLEGLPQAGMTELAPADGAFYVWARTDHLAADSKDLAAQWLRELGVAATPGVDFDPEHGRRFMRFSFCGSTESMHAAVDALGTWRLRQLAH